MLLAPEVIQGKIFSSKADVWALGVVLYELIMHKKPFNGESVNALLQQITDSPFEPLREDVDQGLKNLVSSLLNKDERQRLSIFELA